MRKSILVISFLMLIVLPIAYSQRLPRFQEQPYYNPFIRWLNVSHTENGTLKAGLNISSFDFNSTGTLIGNTGNFTYINVSRDLVVLGSIYGEIPDAFKLGNASRLPFSNYTSSNFTADYDARSDRFGIGNYSNEYSSSGYKRGNYSDEYSSTGYKLGNLSSSLGSGAVSTILTTTLSANNIIVLNSLVIIGNITTMNVTNLNVNGSLIPTLDNTFYVGNGSNRWIGNFSTLHSTTLIGELKDGYKKENVTSQFPNIDQDNTDDQLEANAFKLGNGSLLPFSNFTLENASRLSFSNFQLSNVSNITSWTNIINIPPLSNFQLSNVSNTTSWFNIIDAPTFSNFVLSNLSRIGNFDINTSGSLNVSGNVTFTQLKSCDTINTDINGVLTCGNDAGGVIDTTLWNYANNQSTLEGTYYKLINFTNNYQNISYFGNSNWSTLYNNEASTRYSDSNASDLPFSNFQLSNVSNSTSWENIFNKPAVSNFQLSNVSNNTIGRNENLTLALWNISYGNGTYYYPRDVLALVVIGNLDFSTKNVSDLLTVFGSVSIFGSFNATSVNATTILQSGNQVQTINAVFNKANATTLPFSAFTIENGTRLTFSNFQLSNVSNTTSWSNIIEIPAFSNYQLSNFTSQYDARTDRFGIGNYSTEYSLTGWKIGNMTLNNLGSALANNTNIRVNNLLNITSGNGKNATIYLANVSIMSNGTHWCIPRC